MQSTSSSFMRSTTPLREFLLRGRAIAPLLVMLAVLAASPARAQMSSVTVTVDSITNKGCFNQFIFCGTPDMMIRVSLRQSPYLATKGLTDAEKMSVAVVRSTHPSAYKDVVARQAQAAATQPARLIFRLKEIPIEDSSPS